MVVSTAVRLSGTRVERVRDMRGVTNLRDSQSVTVRVIDGGPVRAVRAKGVIIDVSRAAADALGFLTAGRTRGRLEVVRLPAVTASP